MEKIIKALLSDEKKFENAAKTLYAHADLNGDHIIDYKEFKIQFMKISDDLNLGKPTEEEISEMLDGSIPVPIKPKETKTVKMDDFKTIKTSKYRPTPVISPIFGLEKNYKKDLELENTANYEKLDEEIKKTNEFMMTLKELQQQQNN